LLIGPARPVAVALAYDQIIRFSRSGLYGWKRLFCQGGAVSLPGDPVGMEACLCSGSGIRRIYVKYAQCLKICICIVMAA